MIRIAIFEDNPIMLDAYRSFLNGVEGYTCTGAFRSCDNLRQDIEKSQPDVVLMDIEMYGMNGIEATRKLKAEYPAIKILIQTVYEDGPRILAALCAGANGYIIKSTWTAKMLEAITDVYQGGSAMSPSVAGKVIELFQQHIAPHIEKNEYNLTPREKEILQLMTEGKPLPKIAEQLFLGYETVRSYVKSIYKKLHVVGATEAVAKAIREKII